MKKGRREVSVRYKKPEILGFDLSLRLALGHPAPGCVTGGDASYECSTGSAPFFSSACTAGPSGPPAT